MTLTPEEQAALAAQAPPVTDDPAQPAPPGQGTAVATPPPAGDSPWSAQLESRFTDPNIRAQVDQYQREVIQPYLTGIEQSNADAKRLLDAFESSPDSTFEEVAKELYGEEAAKAIVAALEDDGGAPAPPTPPDPATVVQPPNTPPRDPEVQALLDRQRTQDDKAAFDTAFEATKVAHPDVEFDYDLFIPFVAKEETWDAAVESYKSYVAAWTAKFAPPVDPNDPAAVAAAAAANPPPTVGTGTAAGVTPPPSEKHYNSVGDAIDDWAAEVLTSTGQPLTPPPPPAPPVA